MLFIFKISALTLFRNTLTFFFNLLTLPMLNQQLLHLLFHGFIFFIDFFGNPNGLLIGWFLSFHCGFDINFESWLLTLSRNMWCGPSFLECLILSSFLDCFFNRWTCNITVSIPPYFSFSVKCLLAFWKSFSACATASLSAIILKGLFSKFAKLGKHWIRPVQGYTTWGGDGKSKTYHTLHFFGQSTFDNQLLHRR